MKKLLTSVAFAAATLASPVLAEYPTGPVQFIVPWPPGDFEDILTRMIAADMAEATGQPASVVNRPGGGDGPFPGALEVLEAPSDGSVIGSFVIGVPIVGPQIDIGIDEDSFVPVGIFLTYPFVLAA
ncbi:MAG: tripartite tricarboxylate transporter substrate binding protein, partial [Pseudomonadota bacterium]